MDGVGRSAYQSDKLRLGDRFQTYLFFELPPPVFFSPLKTARLILFKIPLYAAKSPLMPQGDRYSVCPLLDFFSVYSDWYAPVRIDDSLCMDYEDQVWSSSTQIDITEIAAAWIGERLENKGLLLTGYPNARPVAYASDRYETAGMRPMLRLTYAGTTRPLSAAPCTVGIAGK